MLPKHFLFEAELALVVVVVTHQVLVGHLRSQKLVVMDTHWFEAEVAEAAVASNLDFHSCSHLLNRVHRDLNSNSHRHF